MCLSNVGKVSVRQNIVFQTLAGKMFNKSFVIDNSQWFHCLERFDLKEL